MASVNIGQANANDEFYRYKMPKLQSRIQGRGNGIKTEVVNNVDIAKALERAPEYILKFYGCELGAQTNFDKKTGVSIVNGAHDTKKLVELLEAFIKKYVQCYKCGNPETVIKIKRENISLACKACGEKSGVDMKHRLNTYILKNPPEEKLSKAEKKLRRDEKERLKEAAGENLDKEEKKKKKKDKDGKRKSKSAENGHNSPTQEEEGEGDEDDDEDDDIEWSTDTSAAAAQKRAEEQLSSKMADMVTHGNIEAEQEAAKKKEAKRKAEEEAARKAQEEAERQAREDAERRVREEAERRAREEAEKNPSIVDQVKESLKNDKPAATVTLLTNFQVENGPAERLSYLLDALLTGVANGKIGLNISTHQAVLKGIANDPAGQMALLIALEYFLTTTAPTQLKQVLHVLKAFIEHDIVMEKIVLGWHGRIGTGKALGVSNSDAEKVRKAAQPFIDWLEESEEEDSEEESEEE